MPDTGSGYENEQRYSTKTIHHSTQKPPPPSSYHRQYTQTNNLSSSSIIGQEVPPALPPRKPLDKKNSTHSYSTNHALSTSPSQISSTNTNDTTAHLLGASRILPSKEVRLTILNTMLLHWLSLFAYIYIWICRSYFISFDDLKRTAHYRENRTSEYLWDQYRYHEDIVTREQK